MKQFQFVYQNENQLRNELIKIRQWSKSKITSYVTFQILSEELCQEKLERN